MDSNSCTLSFKFAWRSRTFSLVLNSLHPTTNTGFCYPLHLAKTTLSFLSPPTKTEFRVAPQMTGCWRYGPCTVFQAIRSVEFRINFWAVNVKDEKGLFRFFFAEKRSDGEKYLVGLDWSASESTRLFQIWRLRLQCTKLLKTYKVSNSLRARIGYG